MTLADTVECRRVGNFVIQATPCPRSLAEDAVDSTRKELEDAIDAVATMLRSIASTPMGGEPRDRVRHRALFEAWARHVTVIAPPPGTPQQDGDDAAPRVTPVRDWRGLARAFVDHRRREQAELRDNPLRTMDLARDATPAEAVEAAAAMTAMLRGIVGLTLPGCAAREPEVIPLVESWVRHLAGVGPNPGRQVTSPRGPRPGVTPTGQFGRPGGAPATGQFGRPATGATTQPPPRPAPVTSQAGSRPVAPATAQQGRPAAVDAAVAGARGRDWDGIAQTFLDLRQRERHDVRVLVDRLGATVWELTQSAARLAAADSASDQQLELNAVRLRQCLDADAPPDQLRAEVHAFIDDVERLVAERERVRHAERELIARELRSARAESERDPLTELFNRRALEHRLSVLEAEAPRDGDRVAILVIDVDRFKQVNDLHGHLAGDAVLCEVAEALRRCFSRSSDFVARYGGDEFVVVLDGADVAGAWLRADALRRAIQEHGIAEVPAELAVTLSIGLAERRPGEPFRACIGRADAALRQAKGTGRGQIGVADNDGVVQVRRVHAA